jgi:hypothetical protein
MKTQNTIGRLPAENNTDRQMNAKPFYRTF